MRKQKDNLTDIVERLPKIEISSDPKAPKNQQVVNSDGQLITLGKKPEDKVRIIIQGKVHELSIVETKKIIKSILEEKMDEIVEEVVSNFEKKYKGIRINTK